MSQKKRNSNGRTTPKKNLSRAEVGEVVGSSGVQLNRAQRRAVAQGKVHVPQAMVDQINEIAAEHGVDVGAYTAPTSAAAETAGPSSPTPRIPGRVKAFAAIAAAAAFALGVVAAVLTGSFAVLLGVTAVVAVLGAGMAAALGSRHANRMLSVVAFGGPVLALGLVAVERSWWGSVAVLGCGLATVAALAIRKVFAPLPRVSAAHRAMLTKAGAVITEAPVGGGMDTVAFPNGAIAVVGSVNTGDAAPGNHPEVRRFIASSKRLVGSAGRAHIGTLVVVDALEFGPELVDGAVVCSATRLRNAPAALRSARS